jgi:iron-sulfur cluster assembly protein
MIHISPAAISEINRRQSQHTYAAPVFLRIAVQSGGCADLYYILALEEALRPDDQVWDIQGVQVAVESSSLRYLSGLTLDYSEDLMGGGFRFHNPNAVQSCGCGNSFSISDMPISHTKPESGIPTGL